MKGLAKIIGIVLLLHSPVALAANLVTNPGFETADFTGWTQSGISWFTYVSETDPHSGQYEASLGPFDTLGYLSQNLTTVPGATYEISWWLATSDDPIDNHFIVSFGDTVLFDQTGIPPQPWTKYTFTATATATSTTLQFGFANRPGFFFLDDVDVHETGVAPGTPSSVGVFRPSDGTFYLDYNATGQWDGCGTDRCLQIGMSGDTPIVGDWNGTGTSKVGVFRAADGTFYLDYDGNGMWDGCGTDRCLQIGMSGDVPLVGDWNGTGSAKVGVFRPADGTFYLDYDGNGTWDGCGTDRCLQIGMSGDVPLVGDWNASGFEKVGAFRPSDGTFYLDYDGSGTWDGCGTDRCLQIGMLNDIPLVGDWNGSGTSKVGAFRPGDGTFYLDYNGSGTWEGCGTDRCLQIGLGGDIPLVGRW